jgi:protein-S-isoprenylcysteine O-methyltransferase Ste14
VFFGTLSLLMILALARWAPLSLEARVQRGAVKNQPAADKVASAVLGILNLAWFIFIAIDVHRLQIFPMPPNWLSILGAAVGLGYTVMVTAIWQNPYAAPIVGDQSERHQVVIDSGIYARVRHPLYLGYLAFLAGLALWLGSVSALIVLPVVFAPVIARILIEEKTLRETLPGYDEYQKTVRSRLVPAVW